MRVEAIVESVFYQRISRLRMYLFIDSEMFGFKGGQSKTRLAIWRPGFVRSNSRLRRVFMKGLLAFHISLS